MGIENIHYAMISNSYAKNGCSLGGTRYAIHNLNASHSFPQIRGFSPSKIRDFLIDCFTSVLYITHVGFSYRRYLQQASNRIRAESILFRGRPDQLLPIGKLLSEIWDFAIPLICKDKEKWRSKEDKT